MRADHGGPAPLPRRVERPPGRPRAPQPAGGVLDPGADEAEAVCGARDSAGRSPRRRATAWAFSSTATTVCPRSASGIANRPLPAYRSAITVPLCPSPACPSTSSSSAAAACGIGLEERRRRDKEDRAERRLADRRPAGDPERLVPDHVRPGAIVHIDEQAGRRIRRQEGAQRTAQRLVVPRHHEHHDRLAFVLASCG